MTEMWVPAERPSALPATADTIAAAALLLQSLEKLGENVPPWVRELAAGKGQEDGAGAQNGRLPSSQTARRAAREVRAAETGTGEHPGGEVLPGAGGADGR